jgi:hypothetical protein
VYVVRGFLTVNAAVRAGRADGVTRNHESLVVIREMPEVARRFEAEFDRLWQESRDSGGEAP